MKLCKYNKVALLAGLAAMAAVVAQPALAEGKKGAEGLKGHHMMMGYGKDMAMHGFSKIDSNNDGFVSSKEMNGFFSKMDADHDGKVSKSEWQKHMQKMHGEFMQKRMKQCKPGMMGMMGGSDADYSGLNQ